MSLKDQINSWTLVLYQSPAAKGDIQNWASSRGDKIVSMAMFAPDCPQYLLKYGEKTEAVQCVPMGGLEEVHTLLPHRPDKVVVIGAVSKSDITEIKDALDGKFW